MTTFYVYILASHSRVLYIGVTNDLERRLQEHKAKMANGFTSKYNMDRLVFYEDTTDVTVAIEREKQLKGWTRAKKIALIERMNPFWDDLSDHWNDQQPSGEPSCHLVLKQYPSTTASTPSLRMTKLMLTHDRLP